MTVEDCLQFVKNRFDLVLKASKRARQLELGEADPLVSMNNDKMTVVALREIAAGFDITRAHLRHETETLVSSYRNVPAMQATTDEQDNIDL